LSFHNPYKSIWRYKEVLPFCGHHVLISWSVSMQFVRVLACAMVCAGAISAWAADSAKPLNLTLPQSVIGSAPAASSPAATGADSKRCADLRAQRDKLQKDPIDRNTGTISTARKSQIKGLNAEMQKSGCWGSKSTPQ
jgi:hypothetical protein